MRVSPPASLRLDREVLLRDIRDRLSQRIPAYGDDDIRPTDPGWMMIEEAAWMVELLSEQLDRYPLSVVRQLLHLMGAEPLPATPAVGLVHAKVTHAGVLHTPPELPPATRMFTAQTETRDLIEFVPLEARAALRPADIGGIVEQRGGTLFAVGVIAEGDLEGQSAVVGPPRPLTVFEGERVRFRMRTTNPDDIREALTQATEGLLQRRIGWLDFQISDGDTNELVLTVKVDPDGCFRYTVPEGFAPGGDVVADIGLLDDHNWQPTFTIADDERTAARFRGREPARGPRNNTRLIQEVAPQSEIAGLLRPRPQPLPTSVITAIWRTLTNLDSRLARLRVSVERYLEGPALESPEARWVSGVLALGDWDGVIGGAPCTIVCVDVPEGARKAGPLRVTTVSSARAPGPSSVRAVGLGGSARLRESPRVVRAAWQIDLPGGPDERGLRSFRCWEIDLVENDSGVLLLLDETPEQVLLNTFLVINAPVKRDEREIIVERAVPEAVDLIDGDLVTPGVIARLTDAPLPGGLRDALHDLPLARMIAQNGEVLRDYAGMSVDPAQGRVVINAPDSNGVTHRVSAGGTITVQWVRRTDGAMGNVEANAIEYVEQPPGSLPLIAAVRNPAPTTMGSARERDEECMDRLFGPQDGLPILPGDWERHLRARLGARGRDWLVRVWGHAERSLLTTHLWPLAAPLDPSGAEPARVRAELERAGPETLLVVVGPQRGEISEADVDWARQIIEAAVARVQARLPNIRKVVVARLWPLTVDLGEEEAPTALPTFDAQMVAGGLLEDGQGRRAPAPLHGLFLNAAVVSARAAQRELR